MKISTHQTKNAAGFTLVEIALALLVVAVGLVVVVGLFPSGLRANKTSIDETQMAMVADEILNGVKAVTSERTWGQMAAGSFALRPPAYNFWDTPAALRIGPASGPGSPMVGTNVFTYAGEKVPAYAYRYDLQVFPIPGTPNILGVKLQLWNGEYGPADQGHAFYTEIYYNGNP